jgi:hypothetical protein
MALRKDVTGMRFGSLVCIEYVGRTANYDSLYSCRCDCGQMSKARRNDLVSNKTRSCGCGQGKFTHGLSRRKGIKRKLYSVWIAMRSRCNNNTDENYKNYGGRGISVCKEWSDYFAFHEWATVNGYHEGLSLERKDNNSNYCPSNCTWIPRNQQPLNTRRLKYLTLNGETHSRREWSNITGIKKETIRGRIRKGWDVKDILTREVVK